MTKLQFLLSLHERLSDLPSADVEERLSFYSEMIEDRMEEGLSEEEAVCAVGSVEEVAAQIISEFQSIKTPAKQTAPKRKWRARAILLLVLGCPVWLPLLIAAAAVILALYICLWAVIICLWAAFGAVAGSGVGCIAAGIGSMIYESTPSAVAMLGAGLVCAGLSVFLFWGCKAATKGAVLLTKKLAKSFRKKEGA